MSDSICIDLQSHGVAHLTINRPDKHNALTGEMLDALSAAAGQLAAMDEVRVVVLRAEGKSFCAGGDLGWFKAQAGMDRATRITESRKIATALRALAALPQPLIGRVQGNAFGGGVGLACVCDVAIGVNDARFGLTETRLGVIPANIGPYVINRMGATAARSVFMSSRIFEAAEAQRLNILTRVVAAEALDEAINAEVAPYLDCAPGAVRAAKSLLKALSAQVTDSQIDMAIDALADRWDTAEAQEGISAFLEKRAPRWRSDLG